MIATLIAAGLATASAPVAMPTYPTLPRDLAEAAAAFDRAQVKGDRATLERLLADDYLLVNSGGGRETKAEFIHDLTAPGVSQEPFAIDDQVIRLWPGGAVLGGVATLAGTAGGKRYVVRLRFSDIWARRGGRWQVIYTDASRAVPPLAAQ